MGLSTAFASAIASDSAIELWQRPLANAVAKVVHALDAIQRTKPEWKNPGAADPRTPRKP